VLIRHLRQRRRDVAWLAAWSFVQSLPAVASGWSLAQATTQFLAGRTALGLAWLGVLAAAALAGAFGTRQLYLRIGMIVEPFRDALVTAIVDGALARPDTRSVARLTHQAEIVRDSVAGVLGITCTLACTMVSTLVGLVTLLPATLPYVVPPLLASVILLRLLLRPYAARQRAAVLTEESVAAEVARAASAARDITACGAEALVLDGLDRHIAAQEKAARRVASVGAARLLCLAVGGWLPLLLVLAAAPGMLRHGASPGDIVGAVTYVAGSLRGVLYTLSQGMGAGLVRLNVTLERILQTSAPQETPAETPPETTAIARRPAAPNQDQDQDQDGALELRDVTFAYGPHAEPVISGLTLTVPAGDHLAVVGPSGIGKSSLAGLIAGMLSPGEGKVLFDGLPVAGLGQNWRILIPQEAYVFAGTLKENLRYFHPATTTELDEAAAAIGLTPFITRLGGYDAAISPAALSAGERQLIALTRAYLSPARVVILDEATCHLDPAAEEQAEAVFSRRGGTLIVIAHRISSARRARRILVLDGARPQVGDHSSLLASSVMYADLAGQWDTPSNPERTVVAPPAARLLSGPTGLRPVSVSPTPRGGEQHHAPPAGRGQPSNSMLAALPTGGDRPRCRGFGQHPPPTTRRHGILRNLGHLAKAVGPWAPTYSPGESPLVNASIRSVSVRSKRSPSREVAALLYLRFARSGGLFGWAT
jgi:ATP-binding cassette subfamily C protein